jgi:hypothetical protein
MLLPRARRPRRPGSRRLLRGRDDRGKKEEEGWLKKRGDGIVEPRIHGSDAIGFFAHA